MVEKKMQPDYKPADQVEPMDRVFAVFKVLSIEEVQSPKGLLSLVKVADRSGTLPAASGELPFRRPGRRRAPHLHALLRPVHAARRRLRA